MTIRSLAEVGARLEKAVLATSSEANTPVETYERYEALAIQVLDSECFDFAGDALQDYLMAYLQLKALELGIGPLN